MDNQSNSSVITTISDISKIVDDLTLLLSEKEKIVIKKRFNLEGKGRETLEEIGKEFSVTRERVRQIEKNALNKMKRNVFNTNLKDLHEFISNTVRNHGGIIKKESIFKKIEEIKNLKETDKEKINLSIFLHQEIECINNTVNFHPYIKNKEIKTNSINKISKNIINQLNKYGDAESVNRVHKDLRKIFKEEDFDLTKIKSLIKIDKRITTLKDNSIALAAWRHIHPRTLKDKIMFVLKKESKAMHFREISDKIESEKFDKRATNTQAVHNELIREKTFILIGRGIYALTEWGYERGTVADVIIKLLKEKENMSQEEIIKKVLEKRQVKKITIVLSLKKNKNFERIGRQQYRLTKNKQKL